MIELDVSIQWNSVSKLSIREVSLYMFSFIKSFEFSFTCCNWTCHKATIKYRFISYLGHPHLSAFLATTVHVQTVRPFHA